MALSIWPKPPCFSRFLIQGATLRVPYGRDRSTIIIKIVMFQYSRVSSLLFVNEEILRCRTNLNPNLNPKFNLTLNLILDPLRPLLFDLSLIRYDSNQKA